MYKIIHTLGVPDRNRMLVTHNSGEIKTLRVIMEGNNTLNLLINSDETEVYTVTFGGSEPKLFPLPDGNVILNSICDPDTNTNALLHAIEVFKTTSLPIINPPENTLKTTREMACKSLKDIEGVIFPKTIRLSPRRITEVPLLLEKKGLTYPYIFRSAGEHGGAGMSLITCKNDLEKLEQFAFDGRDFYAIEFVDFQSKDKLYRKYRALIIDGVFYPRHLIISKSWNIHSETRKELMDSDEKYRQEELAYLKDPHHALQQHCKAIQQKIPLDFLGIDCYINEKGEMLIFEVNACMRIVANDPIDYQKPYMKKIENAFNTMLEKKITEHTHS